MRYFVGLFLLAWLAGWGAGFANEVWRLLSGGANAFLVVWLILWTLGGAFAVYWAYRAFRPTVPESLRLLANSVTYDSGIPPHQFYSGYTSQSEAWKSMFPRRTRVEIDRHKLQSLRLRETEVGNRLTIDVEASRIDIGRSATEVEREWLYQVLAKRYSLSPARDSTRSDRRFG